MTDNSPSNLPDHAWFRERIPTALADGLAADEQSRFDAHATACPACAAELRSIRQTEETMTDLLDAALPAPGFEDRIIARLRETPMRRRLLRLSLTFPSIHPAVRNAAVAAAAVLVVAGIGYVGSEAFLQTARVDRYAAAATTQPANTQTDLLYGLLGGLQRPSSNAEKDTYGGGTNSAINKWDVTDLQKNLSYSYQNPYPSSTAIGAGFKLDHNVGGEFAVADINGTTGADLEPNQNYGDGHIEPAQNPFQDIQRDNIHQRWYLTQADLGKFESSLDANDSVLAPSEEFGAEMHVGRSATELAVNNPAGGYFLPGEVAAGPAPGAAPTIIIQRESEARQFPQLQAGRITQRGWDEQGQGESRALAEGAVAQPQQQQGQAGSETQARQVVPANAEGANGQPPATRPANGGGAAAPAPAPAVRKVIRNGEVEFEVDSFDSALVRITQLVNEDGGFVATTNSEKLPNGKVKGTIVVRVPPDRLDTFVLKLRGMGDLKNQRITAQDVGKQYTDLESEMRASRAMEERLLNVIKEGKGEIKDLLAAEKELGVVRGRIEKVVGELRYYDNLIALSTLSVTLYERDIRTAAAATESERIDAGVETEDVEAARAQALRAIDEAKGRVVQSDLKRHDAGQLAATVVAEVPPDAAGPLLDRLKQLGKVARLDVERKQTTPDGATLVPGARVERRDTRVQLSLYNLANVAPRETTNLSLAVADVEAGYRSIVALATKAGGRVVSSSLNQPTAATSRPHQTGAAVALEVKSADADGVLAQLKGAGEVLRLTQTENPDTANVTTAKRGFTVQIVPLAAVAPRETTTVQIAAGDVAGAYAKLLGAVRRTGARVATAQLNEAVRDNVTGVLDFEIARAELGAVEPVLASVGEVTQRTSGRAGDGTGDAVTTDSKVRLSVSLVDAERIPPRETTTLLVELDDVERAMADVLGAAASAGGKTVHSNLSKERGGRAVARVTVDVPLEKAADVLAHVKGMGALRAIEASRDPRAPEGKLARARLDVTLARGDAIGPADGGVWATIREGLSTSVAGLLWSLRLVVIGLCFVLPWVVVLWGAWRLARRRRGSAAPQPQPA